MSESTARPRNLSIEALRLVAIAGIAIFHTFQPWFAAATDGTWQAGAPALAALGCVSLLGAYGNNVFFLVSGFFLVPRAARAAGEPGYWGRQMRALGRRALVIGASVALYAAIALAVSAWVVPLDGVSLGQAGWLLGGLEFIWVYLACVAAVPVIGWTWQRVRRPRAVVAALVAAVFAVNAYIAFISPGSEVRGLLEWRKLMSAVTYLVAFLAGGALGEKNLARPGRALAAQGRAVAADTPARRTVAALAPSILGFYVMQSMFFSLWRPVADAACDAGLAAGGQAGLLAAGTVASLVLLCIMLLLDRATRVPLLRALHLA